jgi:hypothetical protein
VGEQLAAGTLRAHRVPEFRQVRCRSVFLQEHRTVEPLLRTFLDCIDGVCGIGSCPVAPAAGVAV